MKKIYLLVFPFLLLLTGCSKDTTEDIIQEIVSEITIYEEDKSDILPKTYEELWAMSLDEFKEMLQKAIPDYRAYFQISEDTVLTDEDWESMRYLLSVQLFGIRPVKVEDTVTEEDPNEIYYAPNKEEILALPREEKIAYLFGMQAFLFPDIEEIDYSLLTEEELEIVLNEYLKDF